MTTVATFSRVMDADLAKARLEAAGIPARIPDEASDVWVLGAAPIVGGVRLQVEDQHASAARSLLEGAPVSENETEDPGAGGHSPA